MLMLNPCPSCPKVLMLCQLCGGNYGSPNPKTGNHYLCEAWKAAEMPTPCLGMKCEVCQGSGVKSGFKGGVVLSLENHPSVNARSIAAQFPPCPDCEGNGYA